MALEPCGVVGAALRLEVLDKLGEPRDGDDGNAQVDLHLPDGGQLGVRAALLASREPELKRPALKK